MLYAFIAEDRAGTLEQRMAARPDHLARLQALQADGRLILAGPCPAIDSPDPGPAGFSGSIIIAEFPSRITSYNVCYTKLLRRISRASSIAQHLIAKR